MGKGHTTPTVATPHTAATVGKARGFVVYARPPRPRIALYGHKESRDPA